MTLPAALKIAAGGAILAAFLWLAHLAEQRDAWKPIVERAAACDKALEGSDRTRALFEIRASCSGAVQHEVAAAAAAADQVANLTEQLDDQIAGTGAAVERAEARGTASLNRRTTADETIRAAPGTPDRRRCDAECLRKLGG